MKIHINKKESYAFFFLFVLPVRENKVICRKNNTFVEKYSYIIVKIKNKEELH